MSLWQMVSSYNSQNWGWTISLLFFQECHRTIFQPCVARTDILKKNMIFSWDLPAPKAKCCLFINLTRQCAVLSLHKIKNWNIKITKTNWHALNLGLFGPNMASDSGDVAHIAELNSSALAIHELQCPIILGGRVALVSILKKIFHLSSLWTACC